MNFDYIIASGDSFTEGCKDRLDIGFPDTWPGLLGSKLNIPWANLAFGGVCNYDIALQPVQKIHEWCTQNPGEKPLLIFNFTIDHRLPYYNWDLGQTESWYSILPEEIQTINDESTRKKIMLEAHIGNKNNFAWLTKMGIKKINPEHDDPIIDGYVNQTYEAIKIANNYKNMFKGATVIWGFIHSVEADGDIRERVCPVTGTRYSIQWPHMDNCYNQFLNYQPLQAKTYDTKWWIDNTDCHPNPEGIKLYADFFESIVDKI